MIDKMQIPSDDHEGSTRAKLSIASHAQNRNTNPTDDGSFIMVRHSDDLPIVLFCGLSIYNEIGGMQRFNQRVIDAAELSVGTQISRLYVISLSDQEHGVRPRPVVFIGCRRSRAALIFSFAKCLLRERPTVVFLGHSNLLPLAPLVRWLLPRTRIALFAHGVEVWNETKFGSRRWYVGPLIRRFVDTVVSVSRFTGDIMRREFRLDRTKIVLLPNATDIEPSLTPDPRQKTSDTRAPKFLSVTRLAEPYKGVAQTIYATARLIKDVPGAQYYIVGDGSLKPELMALARALGVDHAVHFLGRLSDEDLAAAYNRADVFVLPSQKEGFGIVFLEAWKFGLPVICGNRDASQEVVIDGISGLVIDPENIDELEGAMRRLANDPALRERLGRGGFDLLRRKYNQKSFVENFQTVLAALTFDKADGRPNASRS